MNNSIGAIRIFQVLDNSVFRLITKYINIVKKIDNITLNTDLDSFHEFILIILCDMNELTK